MSRSASSSGPASPCRSRAADATHRDEKDRSRIHTDHQLFQADFLPTNLRHGHSSCMGRHAMHVDRILTELGSYQSLPHNETGATHYNLLHRQTPFRLLRLAMAGSGRSKTSGTIDRGQDPKPPPASVELNSTREGHLCRSYPLVRVHQGGFGRTAKQTQHAGFPMTANHNPSRYEVLHPI